MVARGDRFIRNGLSGICQRQNRLFRTVNLHDTTWSSCFACTDVHHRHIHAHRTDYRAQLAFNQYRKSAITRQPGQSVSVAQIDYADPTILIENTLATVSHGFVLLDLLDACNGRGQSLNGPKTVIHFKVLETHPVQTNTQANHVVLVIRETGYTRRIEYMTQGGVGDPLRQFTIPGFKSLELCFRKFIVIRLET